VSVGGGPRACAFIEAELEVLKEKHADFVAMQKLGASYNI
jgi:hypothetical protein